MKDYLDQFPSRMLREELERRAAGEISRMIHAAAQVFGVKPRDIVSTVRGLRIDAARTAVMGIAIEMGHAPETVQRAFRRGSLTTICKARRRWVDELSVSEPLRHKAATIRDLIERTETRK